MNDSQGLIGFLRRVESHVDQSIGSGDFEPSQRELLFASAAQYRVHTHRNPLGDPLAVFYLIARAHREDIDQQGIELGSFCAFYLAALDLLDDVQDEDLGGKPHASVGAGMAINDALTLLFLGLSSLERCMRLETSPARRMQYLKLVNRVALTTGRGQHRDLLGERGAQSPSEVLAMQRQKTASATLLCECAALYAGVNEEERERYRVLGENLTLLIQLLDDVRDVFGKARSPDLETFKMTYPLACFLQRASPAEQQSLATLRQELPRSLRQIRRMFYESGALGEVARTMEECRRAIHAQLAGFEEHAASHRLLLAVVDQLVEPIYTPKPVRETAALRAPRHGFHAHIQRLAKELTTRLSPYGVPDAPPLLPWHQPQFMYDKRRRVIFYPDIDGLPEETLTFQAALLGEKDLGNVAQLMWRQAPAVVAHELFHFFRDEVGLLGADTWQEELAANTLAVAYAARFEPAALAGGVALAQQVLSRVENQLSERAQQLLAELLATEHGPSQQAGYGLDLQQCALVQLAMIQELARAPAELEAALSQWLGAATVAA